jgi:hypothetical protein
MIIAEILEATTRAWGKKGSSTSLKYRCTTGPRKGQVRASAAACMAPINIKKRATLKHTKAAKSNRIAIKTAKTKRTNQNSKRIARMNAGARRKKI